MAWQEAERVDFIVMASGIADWSIQRYGYFVKSDINQQDATKAFAEELERLPTSCLDFIEKAQNKWMDEGNEFAPNMAVFLQMLKEFHNADNNSKAKPRLSSIRGSVYAYSANAWDGCSTDEDKQEFMKMQFSQERVSDATKYWIRKWLKDLDWQPSQISATLGNGW
jgi:hypothetical protein